MPWLTTLRVDVLSVEFSENITRVRGHHPPEELLLRVPEVLTLALAECVGDTVEMEMQRDDGADTGSVIAFHRLDTRDDAAAWDAWYEAAGRPWDDVTDPDRNDN